MARLSTQGTVRASGKEIGLLERVFAVLLPGDEARGKWMLQTHVSMLRRSHAHLRLPHQRLCPSQPLRPYPHLRSLSLHGMTCANWFLDCSVQFVSSTADERTSATHSGGSGQNFTTAPRACCVITSQSETTDSSSHSSSHGSSHRSNSSSNRRPRHTLTVAVRIMSPGTHPLDHLWKRNPSLVGVA
jgi:hypothetical protein